MLEHADRHELAVALETVEVFDSCLTPARVVVEDHVHTDNASKYASDLSTDVTDALTLSRSLRWLGLRPVGRLDSPPKQSVHAVQ